MTLGNHVLAIFHFSVWGMGVFLGFASDCGRIRRWSPIPAKAVGCLCRSRLSSAVILTGKTLKDMLALGFMIPLPWTQQSHVESTTPQTGLSALGHAL